MDIPLIDTPRAQGAPDHLAGGPLVRRLVEDHVLTSPKAPAFARRVKEVEPK